MNKMLVTLVLALMTTAVSAQGTGQSQNQQPATSQTQSGAPSQAQPGNAGQSQPGSGQSQQPAMSTPPGTTNQSQPSNAGQSQPASGQSQSGNKEIKDPNEYNAYISALNTADAAQKAAAMEAFVKQYPQSVVKLDAQEQAMAAYQGANNPAKVREMALAILQDNPNHVRARAIVTAFDRAASTNGDTTTLKEGCDAAQKGLQGLSSWTKPEGMADGEYEKAKTEMTEIFNGTAGFCALQNKDYATAKTYYQKAIEVDPKNLQDTFQLAVADLESNPIDLNGFWYAAKAVNLAGSNAQTVKGINDYAKPRYKNYTGNYDGWDQLVANAATQTAPPADLQASIKAKPTPCEVAVDAVNKNDPGTLSFSDWEFILSHATCSPANKQAADKVWQAIQSKEKSGEADVKLKLPQVLVISATKNEIQAAITEENQQAKKADLKVNLEKPVLRPPVAGSTIDVVGVISSYTPEPFMFTMDKGDVPGAKPAPKKTVHHAQTARRRKAS